jgi:hypothetical protein
MHKMEFGQAYCKDLLKRVPMKFISYFCEPYYIFYACLNFIRFSENVKEIEKFKNPAQWWAATGPRPSGYGLA